MAYKGNRDPELGILIPINACMLYQSKTAGELVECVIPPEHIADYSMTRWPSIMVRPDQVRNMDVRSAYLCAIGYAYNMIYVNDGAEVKVTTKDDRHVTLTTKILYPAQLAARWFKYLRYERYRNYQSHYVSYDLNVLLDCPSDRIAKDFARSGLTALEYLNRLPLVVR